MLFKILIFYLANVQVGLIMLTVKPSEKGVSSRKSFVMSLSAAHLKIPMTVIFRLDYQSVYAINHKIINYF